jgi:hypothetical protein
MGTTGRAGQGSNQYARRPSPARQQPAPSLLGQTAQPPATADQLEATRQQTIRQIWEEVIGKLAPRSRWDFIRTSGSCPDELKAKVLLSTLDTGYHSRRWAASQVLGLPACGPDALLAAVKTYPPCLSRARQHPQWDPHLEQQANELPHNALCRRTAMYEQIRTWAEQNPLAVGSHGPDDPCYYFTKLPPDLRMLAFQVATHDDLARWSRPDDPISGPETRAIWARYPAGTSKCPAILYRTLESDQLPLDIILRILQDPQMVNMHHQAIDHRNCPPALRAMWQLART